jgi:hypothetical protein
VSVDEEKNILVLNVNGERVELLVSKKVTIADLVRLVRESSGVGPGTTFQLYADGEPMYEGEKGRDDAE